MTTSFSKTIDQTEGKMSNGNVVNMVSGGAITAGMAVKLSSGTVVVTSANDSVFYGVALDTTSGSGELVRVARSGCKVVVPYTIAADGYVGCAAAGALTTYAANTICGICEVSATLASVVRII